MKRTAEQEARRYLRLFPKWMRAERGEEVLGLTLDQLPEGAAHLPLRLRVELLRAGLHARRRGTPPPRVWNQLAYTSVFRNDPVVPVQWRPWLASVIMTRWITVVYAVIRTAPALVYPVMQLIVPISGDRFVPLFLMLLWLAFAIGLWVVRRERWRSTVLDRNGFGPDGRPRPPHEVGLGWTRQSVPNTWTVPALAGFALVGGVYGPVAWFQADRSSRPGLLLSLGVIGIATGIVAGARSRLGQVADAPETWRLAKDDRGRIACSGACGAGAGLLWSWTVAFAAMLVGVALVAVVAAPLAAVVLIVLVRRTERRIGRRIGEWDLHPSWAPQPVQRPIDQLSAPPRGPSTPALG